MLVEDDGGVVDRLCVGRGVVFRELALDELADEGGLADPGGPQDDHFYHLHGRGCDRDVDESGEGRENFWYNFPISL